MIFNGLAWLFDKMFDALEWIFPRRGTGFFEEPQPGWSISPEKVSNDEKEVK